MSFYDRYVKCCKEAGIHPSSRATSEQIGCANSTISAFAKSGLTPRGDIVAGASKMLNVSSDYLLGIIDAPRPINDDYTAEELKYILLLRKLNKEGVDTALNVIEGMSKMDVYKKE